MKLPEAFIKMMHDMLTDGYEAFESSLFETSPVSIRKNQHKSVELGLCSPFFDGEESVGWCSSGFYLPNRPSFTQDPLFHAGCYYVQEASSMFVEQFVKQHVSTLTPLIALDLCAAPGGKSTLLSSILPPGSLLVSNEIIHHRCNILCENMIKWGDPNIVITCNSSAEYHDSGLLFDLILCDAPCSGEGMFRKDSLSVEEWSLDNVKMCARRQREILSQIWGCLKPGGILIYSTCTYNIHEDEENALFIRDELGGEPLSVKTNSLWGIDTHNYSRNDIPIYHFFPHKTRGEGFFVCGFQKAAETTIGIRKRRKEDKKKSETVPKEIKNWIQTTEEFDFISEKEQFHAFPRQHIDFLESMSNYLRIRHYGVHLASIKGKKMRPEQSLAMSRLVNLSAFPIVEVEKTSALSYLRCEAIQLDDCPRGYVLLTYRGYPLGFVNNIGSRANNLYPEQWRIRGGKI